MHLKKVEYSELPNKLQIIEFFYGIRNYLFPNYFDKVDDENAMFEKSKNMFKNYICDCPDKFNAFFGKLDEIYETLLTDIEWTFESDPACQSYEEAVISYPGIYAIISYRIAHVLYGLGLKTEARIISENAHTKTGIDINPGAQIDNYFFIDHGTGVVIGETTIIGHHVKIYQGVTLGAKTLPNPRELVGVKRHPTIGNYVTIYANASILGGETVVGDHCIIGGSVFLTKSIKEYSKVTYNDNAVTMIKSKQDE